MYSKRQCCALQPALHCKLDTELGEFVLDCEGLELAEMRKIIQKWCLSTLRREAAPLRNYAVGNWHIKESHKWSQHFLQKKNKRSRIKLFNSCLRYLSRSDSSVSYLYRVAGLPGSNLRRGINYADCNHPLFSLFLSGNAALWLILFSIPFTLSTYCQPIITRYMLCSWQDTSRNYNYVNNQMLYYPTIAFKYT